MPGKRFGMRIAMCFSEHIKYWEVMNKSFWSAGHRPTLLAAFLYFDLSFMVWVMLGPLGVRSEERRVGKECA